MQVEGGAYKCVRIQVHAETRSKSKGMEVQALRQALPLPVPLHSPAGNSALEVAQDVVLAGALHNNTQ